MLSSSEQVIETKQAVRFLLRNSKKLIFYTSLSVILAIVITFFIPKEYYSYGIVFPPANPSLENNVDNPNFGYDVEADRLIQIFTSREIRDSVINRFDLLNYYELDKADEDWMDQLVKKYRNDIKFERTAYMSIVVSAQTKDPFMSAEIVNYIIEVTNKVREKIYKQNLSVAYKKAYEEFNKQKNTTDSTLALLKDGGRDMDMAGLALLAPNAQLNLNFDKISGIKSGADNISFAVHLIDYKHQLDRLNESESRLYKTRKMLNSPIPSVYIIDRAEASHKKVFPSFLINILVIGGITFLFTTLILSLKEN
jgi:uncharacterized protein involved in exopolysaccharide biosynthesis